MKMLMFGGELGFDVERVVGFKIGELETKISLAIGGGTVYDITIGKVELKAEVDEWLTLELCESE